mmetsp:Transcript_35677/g.105433  ORF Transcript_35677/g.105433 Transcript_35677/m.105433 type:complete len:203 (+) Transcript_35677:1138-1746(+)
MPWRPRRQTSSACRSATPSPASTSACATPTASSSLRRARWARCLCRRARWHAATSTGRRRRRSGLSRCRVCLAARTAPATWAVLHRMVWAWTCWAAPRATGWSRFMATVWSWARLRRPRWSWRRRSSRRMSLCGVHTWCCTSRPGWSTPTSSRRCCVARCLRGWCQHTSNACPSCRSTWPARWTAPRCRRQRQSSKRRRCAA